MPYGWIVLLVCAVGTGCAFAAGLVARRGWARLWTILAIATLLPVIGSTAFVFQSLHRADTSIAAVFIAIGGTLGGLTLGAALVPWFTRLPPVPAPVIPAEGSHPVPGPPAVILLAACQPEAYDPTVVTQEYAMLSEADVPVPSDALRLFAYMSERIRYRVAGPSPSRPSVRATAARLEERLRGAGRPVRVYEAWTKGTPRLVDAALAARADGASRAVVVHLGINESEPFERARHDADETFPIGAMRLLYASPLWPEVPLARTIAARAQSALPDGPLPRDGVVLVGDGQPWQWDTAHPASCEQETTFLQRIRSMLISAGMDESHVRIAWLDWQDPGVTEAVRHLAALGCDRIVVVPATMPADSLETAVDLPAAIAQAAVDRSVAITVLRAWGEDPVVVEILADVTLRALEDAETQ